MNDSKSPTKPKNRDGDAPEMRVVGIDFNPGPDAHDRLRRLFTILVKLADDTLPVPGTNPPPNVGGEEDI